MVQVHKIEIRQQKNDKKVSIESIKPKHENLALFKKIQALRGSQNSRTDAAEHWLAPSELNSLTPIVCKQLWTINNRIFIRKIFLIKERQYKRFRSIALFLSKQIVNIDKPSL